MKTFTEHQNKLGGHVARALKLHKLNTWLQRQLPPAWAADVQVGNLEHGLLVLFCSNAGAAGRVKQMHHTLLHKLQLAGVVAEHLEVKIRPVLQARPAKPKAGLPPAAIAALQQVHATLPDSPLKASLERAMRRKTST